MSISVVIPTRDRLRYLKESVASARAQTGSSCELIVIDDASEDGTWDWLQTVADGRTRVIRQSHRGERSATRNRGWREALGEAVLFLDDDDVLEPGALRALAAALERESAAIAAVGGFVRYDEHGVIKRGAHPRYRTTRDAWTDVLVGWVGTLGRSLITRRVLEQTAGFTEGLSFGEDWEFWLRATQLGPIVCVPDIVLRYRVHREQSTSSAWRQQEARILADVVAGLPPAEAVRAQRVLRARRMHEQGREALKGGDPSKAMRHFVRSFSSAPFVYLSPMQRRRMLIPFLKGVVSWPLGTRGLSIVRRTLSTLR